MLSEAHNQQLTSVGPDARMGQVLRRYWHPIAGVSEFDSISIKPIRLFGEDLVLYKDLGGTFGLVDRRCAHRRADLSYGFVEPTGIRCNYHGWRFNAEGKCIEQPYEDVANPNSRIKEKCNIKAYPVQAHAGMLWAYMGPQPAPVLPNWEPFSWTNGFRQVVISAIPCNWLQCQENSIDPVHFEWMHSNWSLRQQGNLDGYSPTHTKLEFEEFEYGFVYKRQREDTDENHPLWTVGRVCLWPNAFFLGDHFEWRVPIDDRSTLSVGWFFVPVPSEARPYVQENIPTWYGPVTDEKTGRLIDSHVMNQDFVGWIGQGEIADRTTEHLGASDRGITMVRRRLFADVEAVEQGEDPKGVIRNVEAGTVLPLPIVGRDALMNGVSHEEYVRHPQFSKYLEDFPFQYGQPKALRDAYFAAIGAKEDESGVGRFESTDAMLSGDAQS